MGDAPILALFEKWLAGQATPRVVALLRGRRSDVDLEDLPVVDSYRTGFAQKVGAEATPAPQFRRRDQSALYWIAMHITQFLDTFVLAPDVEIVESFLPDMLRDGGEETGLRGVAPPSRLCQNAARKAEFEGLHDSRRILLLRFADQQVNVFGHDHVAGNDEAIAPAYLLQHSQKEVTAARGAEHWLSPVTTASDEMQVSGTIIAP
jgi:hypothetical protein